MITIRRRHLRRLAIGLAVIGCTLLASLGFYAIGRAVSPIDPKGHPMILSPNIVSLRQYQGTVLDWTIRLRVVHGALVDALNKGFADLYGTSEAVAAQVGELDTIQSEIAAFNAPPGLVGLRDMAQSTVDSYQEAAKQVAVYIAQPSADRQQTAIQILNTAGNYLLAMEDSPWLKNRY